MDIERQLGSKIFDDRCTKTKVGNKVSIHYVYLNPVCIGFDARDLILQTREVAGEDGRRNKDLRGSHWDVCYLTLERKCTMDIQMNVPHPQPSKEREEKLNAYIESIPVTLEKYAKKARELKLKEISLPMHITSPMILDECKKVFKAVKEGVQKFTDINIHVHLYMRKIGEQGYHHIHLQSDATLKNGTDVVGQKVRKVLSPEDEPLTLDEPLDFDDVKNERTIKNL